MTKVCILGSSGNMGRRYAAICSMFNIPWYPCDPASRTGDGWMSDEWTHFIIASPTEKHLGDLLKIRTYQKTKRRPVLCEKPILMADNLGALAALQAVVEMHPETYMVNNYAFVDYYDLNPGNTHTLYDFYQSGPHGPSWDCIQLIYLAQAGIALQNVSPVWFAQINGRVVNRSSIDTSYCDMVRAFVNDRDEQLWGPEKIVEAHRKVLTYEELPLEGEDAA